MHAWKLDFYLRRILSTSGAWFTAFRCRLEREIFKYSMECLFTGWNGWVNATQSRLNAKIIVQSKKSSIRRRVDGVCRWKVCERRCEACFCSFALNGCEVVCRDVACQANRSPELKMAAISLSPLHVNRKIQAEKSRWNFCFRSNY